jgi:hypothetical protein
MGKANKKIRKLKDRIASLEADMIINLKQKTSNTAEISLGDYQRKIEQARKELSLLEK